MKIKRKIIQIDEEKCDGCGNCILNCAEGALAIVDGKAKVISDNLCDGLGACLGECPQDALHIVERQADAFDEHAVEEHLRSQKIAAPTHAAPVHAPMACGCPSSQIQSFSPCAQANRPRQNTHEEGSALTHWPVQIHLVPPTAPFLKGADLLVTADCVPVALPGFHQDLLQGKTVLMGCPKLDDAPAYVEKFSAIFKTAGIKSVTVAIMEVPCCAGLPRIVQKALQQADVKIPFRQVVVGRRGRIIEEGPIS
jgi:Pyruvate/2-oxoacid:ferredoxin oxidoreductase delta subunit